MNNKPITARVKSGMFKTKEPLLNVGPAGVDGNNKTRTMPSPSKMKGYTMKSSPFKQKETEVAKDNAITSAEKETKEIIKKSEANNQGVVVDTKITNQTPDSPDTTTTETREKPQVGVYRRACGSKNDGSTGTDPQTGQTRVCKQAPAGQEPKETEEIVKTVKGTKGKATVKKGSSKIYEENTGRAQSAYDRRNNARAGRRTDREVNRNSRKLGKYGTYDQDGKFTQRKDLSQREIRKLGIAKNALDRAKKESENVYQQSLQNVGGFSGEKVKNIDRRRTKGSYTKEEQANMPDDDAKTSKTSKTSSFKKPKPTSADIGFTPMSIKELSAGLESRGEAPKEKQSSFERSVMDSPFFKKKSPMKMSYFKK
tara:strand:+ start:110 stop:1216 length:1107 start_codon:yes stop_codon:yes gene_type:complete